jgi:hypothetical protein
MTAWQWYWASVGMLIVVLVVPAELYALCTNVKNTASWSVWDLEQFVPGGHAAWTWTHWLVGGFFFVLFLWLALHFMFGILR